MEPEEFSLTKTRHAGDQVHHAILATNVRVETRVDESLELALV